MPFVLLYAYGIKPLWLSFITVTIGEIISCGVLGMLLLFVLKKYAGRLFPD
ncbi:MAG: QueT transporter family protein [Lachnospiraceae bacterium]|nr:QueT transporter family protein [Lachnospiraceae bacterium]